MNSIVKYVIVGAAALIIGYLLGSSDLLSSRDRMASAPQREDDAVAESNEGRYSDVTNERDEPISASLHPNSIVKNSRGSVLREFLLGDFKDSGGWVSFDIFTPDGRVTKAFADLYSLSDAEVASLNLEVEKAYESYFQSVRANSEISISEDGTASVTILPFEGAEGTYSELLDSFSAALGKEKFADFLELGERFLRERFNEFGGEKLVATLSVDKKNSTEEKTLYEVKQTKKRTGQTLSRTSNNLTEEKLAKEFGLIRRLISEEYPIP